MLITFKKYIENGENFSYVKIGDGEIDCMQFKDGGNIDKHPYSKKLGLELRKSFIDLVDKDVFIGDWFQSNPPINSRDVGNIQYYNKFINDNGINPKLIYPFELFMLGWGNLSNNNLLEFYKSVKSSSRKKIYIGPERLNGIGNYINIDDYITIPLINSFEFKNIIYKETIEKLEDNCILFFSVGLMSATLINDILNYKNNITIVDIGSGFDTLFVHVTRGRKQATPEEAKKYLEILWKK